MDNKDAIKSTALFTNISEEQLAELAFHAKECKYAAKAEVLKEGDVAGSLFIIKEGVLQVYTQGSRGEEIVLARLEKGGFVGEQALLTSTPGVRNASVRALTDVALLKIDHSQFQKVLNVNEELTKHLKAIGFKQLLTRLQAKESEYDISVFLLEDKSTLEVKEFEPGQAIINQGEPPSGVYFLVSGSVDVLKGSELISTIHSGNLIGEFGLIMGLPRQATIVANGKVKALFISTLKFRDLYQKNPQLKEVVDALCKAYQSPKRGKVTQYLGRFLDMPAVMTKFYLADGREIIASNVIGKNIRSIRELNVQNPLVHSFEDKTVYRELQFSENRLTEVIAYGEWEAIKELYSRILDKGVVDETELQNFEQFGDLSLTCEVQSTLAPPDEIICNCMYVSRETVADCIKNGCTTTDEVSNATGAGNVCGACIPSIQTMLGHRAWDAMRIIKVENLSENVRSYKFSPVKKQSLKPFKPGQHVVIQCEIDGKWVERAYTLTSSPTNPQFYEIAVKREDQGLFSRWIFENVEKVPFIRVSKPSGNLIFEPSKACPMICFTAGIGITPAVCFARAISEQKTGRMLLIFNSARTAQQLSYNGELEALASKSEVIKYFKHLTSEKGRLKADEVIKIASENRGADFFICGPKEFETNIASALKEAQIKDDQIFIEKFTHSGGPNK